MAAKITAASSWKKPETHALELPSGNVVEVRPSFPAYLLMRTGQFPERLFKAFQDWQVGILDDPELAGELIDFLVCSTVVKPRMTAERERGAVCTSDLDDRDVETILQVAGGRTPAAGFRDDGDGAGGGADREDVADDAVEPAGDGAGDPAGAGA